MAEELAQHVRGSMEERETRLKREYEEKLRRYDIITNIPTLNPVSLTGLEIWRPTEFNNH